MDFSDCAKYRKIRATLDRGRPFTGDQVRELRRINPPDLNNILARSAAIATERLESGGKLTAAYREGLELIDPSFSTTAPSSPRSTAERVRDHVERSNDIGAPPPCLNPSRREQCRNDLVAFGTTYCASLLDHPPSERMCAFIRAMAATILTGGKLHVRLPRGKGKTTWTKIAMIWSAAYAHRRFLVVISATASDAKAIISDCVSILDSSEEFYEDFPEIAHPFRALEGIAQRCASQHINGLRTEIEITGVRITLPTVAGSKSSGITLRARGVSGSLRGLVQGRQRPDFVFLDDPQTRKSATSSSETQKFLSVVRGDIDGLAGHNRAMATVIATTPVAPGDGSSHLADPEEFPDIQTLTVPLIVKFPKRLDLWDEFSSLFRADSLAGDLLHSTSRAFYVANRAAMDDGCEVLDPADGDPQTEESAIHHAFVRRCILGETAFNAEYQMQVARPDAAFRLEPPFVASRLNGFPRHTIPLLCNECVAFCDINIDAGLRWGVLAVGRRNVTALVAYGRYPETGRVAPENASETEIATALASALAAVTRIIASLPLVQNQKRKHPHALVFDGGYMTPVVAAYCATARAPFKLAWAKGFGASNYRPSDKIAQIGDHIHASASENGTFLAVCADYWREYAQRALLAEPLQPGSLSWYGHDPLEHARLADEICAETLEERYTAPSGKTIWRWSVTGPNHYADVVSGCCAIASWYRLLAPAETLVSDALVAVATARNSPDAPAPERMLPLLSAPKFKKQSRFRSSYRASPRR
jgi:hypothetical protein